MPSLPDLATIVEPLLGLPYEQMDCWRLARHLYQAALGETLDDDPVQAMRHIREVWFQMDDTDPLTLSQPWDCWIFRLRGLASSHVGIVMNTQQFIHTRKAYGVCLEPLRRWRPRLLQIARLRVLA